MAIDMTVLKNRVGDGKKVRFSHYKAGYLYYVCKADEFEFPVPIDDTGDGTFMSEDSAMLYMRYIRKHMKYLDESKVDFQEKLYDALDVPKEFRGSVGKEELDNYKNWVE